MISTGVPDLLESKLQDKGGSRFQQPGSVGSLCISGFWAPTPGGTVWSKSPISLIFGRRLEVCEFLWLFL